MMETLYTAMLPAQDCGDGRTHTALPPRRIGPGPCASLWTTLTLLTLITPGISYGQNGPLPTGYDDHQNMMEQLGIKRLRPGPNPNDQSTFDEARANPYKDSMPDVLRMKDGTKVAQASQWPARRAEI